jgi:uncharacterized protein (TIRG00374 family)
VIWVKRGIPLVALGIVIYLFIPLLSEIRDAADLYRSANYYWLVAAIAIQIVSYCFLTWLNSLSLNPFQGNIRFHRLMGILTSIAFVETAFPTASASGIILRAHLTEKHGNYSAEVSTFSLAIESLFMGLAMGTVGMFGLLFLIQKGEITSPHQIIELVISGALIATVIWAGWSVIQNKSKSRRLVLKIAEIWNLVSIKWHKKIHLPNISPEHLEERLELFQSGLTQFKDVPVWKFGMAAYGRVGLDIATLELCFLMFHQVVTPGTLVIGYGLILMLSGLASLPGGLGVADISIPIIFTRMGVDASVAIAAGLTYRLIAFWLLRFIGFINWQALEVRG